MGLPEAIPLIERAIEKGVFPGAAFALGGRDRFQTAFRGRFEYCPESRAVDADTFWDLASLSKVVGTTSVAMRRFEEKRLDLSAPVSMYLPEFGQNGKERVTIRQLLLHEAGLIPFRPYETFVEPQAVRAAVWAEKLQYPPGTKSIYSDLSMIALQAVLEKVTGETLDRQVELVVGIPRLTYRPDEERCAPTELVEPWRRDLRLRRGRLFANGTYIQGEVHDPTACVLGGVAGHAGLFAPLEALTTFCT
ncbi:class A beta-lactamase-related serine hydrolase, partial [bacterium]